MADELPLAERVRAALGSGDVGAWRGLLTPDAKWGAPDDPNPSCHSAEEVIAWWNLARERGVRATVTEVVPGRGTILVGVKVGGRDGDDPGAESDRWQVLTVRDGLIAEIRGYDEREVAAARAGITG
jgi:ketosteroid isomerase-like protein